MIVRIKKWLCLNGTCEYETDDLDVFIEHLKTHHDIYIDYEVEEVEEGGIKPWKTLGC